MHRLLSFDRQFSYTRLHETLFPLAKSMVGSVGSAAMIEAALRRCNPVLRRIHPSSPLAAEEEFGLHAFSFHGAMITAQWNVPRFARWCEQRDLEPVYREFHHLLATLRWKRGEPANRVQLLKAPQYMEDLDEVLRTFPGARVVRMRRDLDEVVPSTASLVWNQRRVQSDHADRRSIGREWLRKTRLREQRFAEALRRNPQVPVLEVDFQAMSEHCAHELSRVYDFLGMAEPPDLARHVERMKLPSRHVRHAYSLQQFGLREALTGEG